MRYQTVLAPCTCINLLISRTITCNSELLGKRMQSQDGPAKLRNKSSVSVQAKKKEDDMKKFNFENSMLFGSIIPFTGSKLKLTGRDDFPLKHSASETCVPIKEPLDLETNSVDLLQPQLLNVILDFPLLSLNTELKRKSVQMDKYGNRFNYLRNHLQSIGGDKVPSVTKILDKTMPPERVAILERWKSQMIEEMGKEAFEEYQKKLLSTGSSLHSKICDFFCGTEDLQIDAENLGHWNSIQTILPNIKNVEMIEEKVTHPFLQYIGVVDCIAKYRDHLVLIEWKTSKKQKSTLSSTYDYPLQIAAYVGALNFDPRFEYLVKNGLIVIAYEGGTPASTHLMNEAVLKNYWNKWLQRLKLYWEMQ